MNSKVQTGLQASGVGLAANVLFAITKISVGLIGHSYALVADGIESTVDVVSSLIVWTGLRISAKPPDDNHPFGHGKAESMAGVAVAGILIGVAILIAVQSIREIITPHHGPATYTLAVLVVIIVTKEALYRWVLRVGSAMGSLSLKIDAWHHRSDALTSLAALIGISIAVVGGAGYETADDWAALFACSIIAANGYRLSRQAINEAMDAAVTDGTEANVRELAEAVEGVVAIEKCRIRKSGPFKLMDIHVEVDGNLPVREGHFIAHELANRLREAIPSLIDVVVHIEPSEQRPQSNGQLTRP